MRFGQYQKHLWTFGISVLYIFGASACLLFTFTERLLVFLLSTNLLVIFITLIIPCSILGGFGNEICSTLIYIT